MDRPVAAAGLFQQALLRQVTDESGDVASRLQDSAESVLESLIIAR
jgi:hypothetical protein